MKTYTKKSFQMFKKCHRFCCFCLFLWWSQLAEVFTCLSNQHIKNRSNKNTCLSYEQFVQVYLHAFDVLHSGNIYEFEVLLTAELSSHVSELFCYPDQTQVEVKLSRECHYPVPEYTHSHLEVCSKHFDTENKEI